MAAVTICSYFNWPSSICFNYYILIDSLFNLYAEYIMRHARLDEAQARIKIAEWNIDKLEYADDTTFMAESEEELKSLLMEEKEWKRWRRVKKLA